MGLVDLIAAADERALAVTGLACLERCVPLLDPAGSAGDDALRPLWASLADGTDWPERIAAARKVLGADGGGDGAADTAGGAQGPMAGARQLAADMLSGAPDALPDGFAAAGAAGAEAGLREWADACSLAALHVHSLLDATGEPPEALAARRTDAHENTNPTDAADATDATNPPDATNPTNPTGAAGASGVPDAGSGPGAAGVTGVADAVSPLVEAELRRQAEILGLVAEHGAGGLRRALAISVDGRRVLRAAVSRRARAR